MCRIFLNLTGDQVTNDDTFGDTINGNDIHHLATGVHLYLAGVDLAHHGRVGAEQELLSRLTTRIKCTGNLSTTKGAVSHGSAVFTGKRYALGDTLINNVVGHLSQTINVGLTCTEVATFYGVVEEAENGVAVTLIVFWRR